MKRAFCLLLSFALFLALQAPLYASLEQEPCDDHHQENTQVTFQTLTEKADTKAHSHPCTALHHSCCHSPIAHLSAKVFSPYKKGDKVLATRYIFSLPSPFLEGPFQPPEA